MNRIPFTITVSSIVLALLLDTKALNNYFNPFGEEGSSVMTILYIVCAVLLYGLGLANFKRCFNNIQWSTASIVISVALFYFFTQSFIAQPRTSLPYFFIFTITAFIAPSLVSIDARLLLKFMMVFSVPSILKLDQVFVTTKVYTEFISMGTSYSFLPPVIASIVYIFSYYKYENKAQKLVTLILFSANMVFAFYLISTGSRGPVLTIFVTVAYFLIFSYDSESCKVRVNHYRLFYILIATIVVSTLFIPILEYLSSLLAKQGLSFNFIDKVLRLNSEGDITNDRAGLYHIVLQDIWDSPFYGHGFDLFEKYRGNIAPYPHNFLLQVLYDGGIMLFAVIFIPLIRNIKVIKERLSYDRFVVYSALALASIPGACFSGDLWKSVNLWIFFGSIFSLNFIVDNESC